MLISNKRLIKSRDIEVRNFKIWYKLVWHRVRVGRKNLKKRRGGKLPFQTNLNFERKKSGQILCFT